MLSLVTVSRVITAFHSCCLSHHVFDQVNLWPAWVGFETAIFWQCPPGNVETQRLYPLRHGPRRAFRGFKEEFVVARTREVLLYRNSKDLKVSGAGIEIRTGRKWSAARELKIAVKRLQQKAMVGTVARGTRGLGYYPSPRIDNVRGKERRAFLQKKEREGMEETWLAKMVGLSQQGVWTRWENYVRRRITWLDLWRSDFSHLRFQIQAVYDVLPSKSNLHTWGKSDTPACQLCGGKGSLQHLLSGCARSVSEECYR